jgi:hypothetical protein
VGTCQPCIAARGSASRVCIRGTAYGQPIAPRAGRRPSAPCPVPVRARIAIQRIEEQGIDLGIFVEAHEKIVQLLQAGDGAGAGRNLRELIDALLQSILPTSTGGSSARDQTHPADG